MHFKCPLFNISAQNKLIKNFKFPNHKVKNRLSGNLHQRQTNQEFCCSHSQTQIKMSSLLFYVFWGKPEPKENQLLLPTRL